jgi:hypothetical protein
MASNGLGKIAIPCFLQLQSGHGSSVGQQCYEAVTRTGAVRVCNGS